MATADRTTSSRGAEQMRALEEELERYRRASEDALQQLDWCIGYFHGCGKRGIAKALSGKSLVRPSAPYAASGATCADREDRNVREVTHDCRNTTQTATWSARLVPLAERLALEDTKEQGQVLKAAMLVRRDARSQTDQAVVQSSRVLSARLRLRYTGPQPPYAFMEDVVRAGEPEWA